MADKKEIYLFISDDTKKYYRAEQSADGSYSISKNAQPYPIKYNPVNLLKSELEFATNSTYFSLTRSINYPLEFIRDGAGILRHLYFLGKAVSEKAYLTIIEWNSERGLYELSYYGRIDFSQKTEDPKSGVFTVSTIDDSAWGILSQNDSIEYAIDCTSRNPAAVKVVVDGITLLNTYLYQTVAYTWKHTNNPPFGGSLNSYVLPMVLVNESGDSVNIITSNQEFEDPGIAHAGYVDQYLIKSTFDIGSILISGFFEFIYQSVSGHISKAEIIFRIPGVTYITNFEIINPIKNRVYRIPITFNPGLDAYKTIGVLLSINGTYGGGNDCYISIIPSNIEFSVSTIPESQVVYGLRAGDLLSQLSIKATEERFSLFSEFFKLNNKDIVTCGDAIRGVPEAKIYTSFRDFFLSFDHIYFMALRNILGQVWMEQATEVYKKGSTLIDIGEAIDLELIPATEYMANEIVVGSPDIDLRRPSGRLEFNSENSFSIPGQFINKKIDRVSKYRTGCFDIQFLILDYKGSSTQDNSGDKSVYLLKITDELVDSVDNIEDFENITINGATLNPVITSPINTDVISFNMPRVRGVGVPGTNVNIYVDAVLDGNTVVDVDGNWSYNIVTALSSYELDVETGVHVIQATNTDLSGPNDSISITIDDAEPTIPVIVYPANNDSLYNNLPLIKGVGQKDGVVDISINGLLIGSTTCDQSCKWEFKVTVPIPQGDNIVSINAGLDSHSFYVDSHQAYPLITYVGGELNGFLITDNMPLVKGVAIPGTIVKLYLNYVKYVPLGTATANADGNWEIQVVETSYIDPVTSTPVILAPIQNGLNVFSTSLGVHSVQLKVSGYKLSRPAYSEITGVVDNRVFNTEYSPKRMLASYNPMLSAITAKQTSTTINFQTSKKNGTLRTVLSGVINDEDADIPVSSLGNPIAILEWAVIKTKALKSFAKTLYDFNNGGIIKTSFRGTPIYCLPVGSMKIANVASDVQEWKLLLSPETSYTSLLNLYKNGTNITLMKNAIYHSDHNSLHFVTYNYQKPQKYNYSTIYDDWFNDRNHQWLLNPDYIQKYQRTESFIDQIITNGITGLTLSVHSCFDGSLVDTINYEPVDPAPIALPDVVLEAEVDLANYPEGQYFFVLSMMGQTTLAFIVEDVDPGVIEATITGEIISGETVSFFVSLDGGEYTSYSVIVEEGWTIEDIVNYFVSVVPGATKVDEFSFTVTDIENTIAAYFTAGTVTKLAISERIETRDSWPQTFLIESSNSINYTGAFFSTGFKTVLRMEGLIKKLQPELVSNVGNEEDGDRVMLYSNVSRKRVIRFGDAYGLPDYLYLKMANAISTDECMIENVHYTLEQGERVEPSDDVEGHPLYYYEVVMALAQNNRGKVFPGTDGADTEGVVLVVDATAFGMPNGSLININVTGE